MIIDCISDLHGFYPKLEGGDLLIVAGDLTACDLIDQYYEFNSWLCDQEYEKKIIIAGNHDGLLHKELYKYLTCCACCEYLQDSGTEFQGLKIWGCPWSKSFPRMNHKSKAFTLDTEEELYNKFLLIPDDTDILITHSPALEILDKNMENLCVGSSSLYGWLKYIGRPKLHVCGHIHEAYGKSWVFPTCNDKMMTSVNACIMDKNYNPVNKPVRIIL